MIEVGVGLWSMQATAAAPASWRSLFGRLTEEARHVESLGFDGLWFAEHHGWYDGWCPQPLVAAATAAGATTTLRVGTAMALLPLRDPDRFLVEAAQLHELSRGRLDLGVGLGYRDAEFDLFGHERRQRAVLMETGLDALTRHSALAARTFVGGFAAAALARAARRGLGLLLPPTLTAPQVAEAVDAARSAASRAGRSLGPVGIVKDVWVDTDGERARSWFLPRVDAHYREYAGAWYRLRGEPGFSRSDLLDAQMARSVATAVAGDPAEVATILGSFVDAGCSVLVLHLHQDLTRDQWAGAAELMASTVVPALRERASAR